MQNYVQVSDGSSRMWERKSYGELLFHDEGEVIVFKRKSKIQRLKMKLVNLTCSKIDEGPKNLTELVLLKNTLSSLDERLKYYPDTFYLRLTNQKHPYNHLLYRS